MNSTRSNVTSTPFPSSLLAKTGTHSRDAVTATTAAKTAQLWDEYERIALENERRRNRTTKTLAPRHKLSFDLSESYGSHRRTTKKSSRSDSDTNFKGLRMASSSKSLVSCRNCKQIIPFTSQTCQGCQRSDLPRARREDTPISGPPATAPAVTAPSKPQEEPSRSTPIEQASHHVSTSRPQTGQQTPTESSRSRKPSLIDPNEAFLRIQMTSPQTYNATHFQTHATSPSITSASSLHPSAPYSRGSTRPSSFANRYSYHRNNSATPSEMSTLYTCALTQATSPLSLSSVDYALQNIKSAWDDWDSEDENNKTNNEQQQQRKKSSERVKSSGSWIARPRSSKPSTPKGTQTPKGATTPREGKVIERIDSVVTLTVPRRRKVKAKQSGDERLEQARRETREQIQATKMKMQQQQPLLHQQQQVSKRQQAQQQRQLMNRQQLQLQVQKQQQQQPQLLNRRQQIQLQKGPSSKGFFRLISCGCVKNI